LDEERKYRRGVTRLIVTGASGLLGAALLYRGLDAVDILACTHEAFLRPHGFETRKIDLASETQVKDLVTGFKPDWICHCAALTDVDFCQKNPETAHRLNVAASVALARAAADYGARFLLISTDSVYDGSRGWYVETDATGPLNEYAASKLEAERRVRELLPEALIARVNFYGWNLKPKRSLAEWVLGQLEAGVSVSGWTDVFFTPLFNMDLADCLNTMMARGLSGTYHVAGSERCSKYEFARAVAAEWGHDPEAIRPTKMATAGLGAPRPLDTSLRCDKLFRELDQALPDLRTGLRRMREFSESDLSAFRSLLA